LIFEQRKNAESASKREPVMTENSLFSFTNGGQLIIEIFFAKVIKGYEAFVQ